MEEYSQRGGKMKERSIRITARCLFRHEGSRSTPRNEGQILAISGQDPDKPEPHYSVPGGGVEFGETSEQAIRREMKEELGAEIADLELRAVTEEICEVLGRPHHGIVFLYEGRFVDPGFYARPVIPYVEGSEPRARATWMPITVFLSGEKRLVPERLVDILKE
jgi:ADP-ribose pyrophosphatase YjhB (NUDIX family)